MIKTLKDLAEVALRIAATIENIEESVTTPEQFSALQSDLNELQVVAPQCKAVVDARVRWFKHGLTNFEINFVEPVSECVEGWDTWHHGAKQYWPKGLIMHWETLRHFLTRGYLGAQAFAEFYPWVEILLDRLVRATEGHQLNKHWKERRDHLRQFLLEGRL